MAAKDEGMKQLLKAILKVSPEVRDYLLRSYVKQCRKKHAIAFLEWRLHFSKNRKDSLSGTQLDHAEI